MVDPENAVGRWSRLKREAREGSRRDKPAAVPPETEAAAAEPSVATPPEAEIPCDPASLPSIDSIDAATDLRAFFGKGVPVELTRAALRQAWSADPAIRDFVGLSENSWDFNAPATIPGFGDLKVADVRRMVAQVFGETGTAEDDATSAEGPSQRGVPQLTADVAMERAREHGADASAASLDAGVEAPRDDAATAPSSQDAGAAAPARPLRHGGALPRIDKG